jgi:outer membrane protein assembly factor BamB
VWTTPDTTPIGGDRLPAVVGDTLYVPDTSSECWLAEVDAATGEILDRRLVSPESATNSFCLGGDALTIGSTVALRWSYIRLASYSWCSGGILSVSHWGVTVVDVGGGPAGWNVGSEEQTICSVPEERLRNEASSGEPGSVVITEGWCVRQESCTGEGCPEGWVVSTAGFGMANGGAPVVLHNGDLAVMEGNSNYGQVVVIDGTTHTVAWSADVGSAVRNRPLASDPDTIFATTADGRVVAFPIDGCGAATCPPSWTAALTSPASARPAIGGGVLYVGSDDGSVSAFDAGGCGAPTCSPLWTGTTPAAITGAPVVSGGRIIVGSSNGVVTAFALPDTGTGD